MSAAEASCFPTRNGADFGYDLTASGIKLIEWDLSKIVRVEMLPGMYDDRCSITDVNI